MTKRMVANIEFKDFINWAFMALLAGCIMYAVEAVKDLNKAVQVNNGHIATLIERTGWHGAKFVTHEKRLDRHENRIQALEQKN